MKLCIGEHDYLSPLSCFSYSPVALVLISFGQQACTFCHLASSLLGSPAVQASTFTDSAIINLAFLLLVSWVVYALERRILAQ